MEQQSTITISTKNTSKQYSTFLAKTCPQLNALIETKNGEEFIDISEFNIDALENLEVFCELQETVEFPDFHEPLEQGEFEHKTDCILLERLDMPFADLCELCSIALFAGNTEVFELICAKISTIIKDLNVEELIDVLELRDHLTIDDNIILGTVTTTATDLEQITTIDSNADFN